MPATRGALLHGLKTSDDAASYAAARAALGALQSTAEFSMAVAAAGRAGSAATVRDLLDEMEEGGVPRDAWLYVYPLRLYTAAFTRPDPQPQPRPSPPTLAVALALTRRRYTAAISALSAA